MRRPELYGNPNQVAIIHATPCTATTACCVGDSGHINSIVKTPASFANQLVEVAVGVAKKG
ncbi:hypothetical protein QBC46DRAFT_345628 [Diplogelasinospora grovesii]|uniref:Uncharacterized protein n=1 Tax=Diplogelasinospora grovesii TaxID=303347 RepID=A0AAN6S1D3_9PEZI|nr:hypothetical protein QBC46DRAFT_345628 [Diplogelasinospora grovesii]